MNATSRIFLSLLLSVALSAALTLGLRVLLTSAIEKGDGDDGHPDSGSAGGHGRRGWPVINPVNVMVFVPVIIGNNNGPRRSRSKRP